MQEINNKNSNAIRFFWYTRVEREDRNVIYIYRVHVNKTIVLELGQMLFMSQEVNLLPLKVMGSLLWKEL